MSRRNNRNQNATTEEPVVKEDSIEVVAEETAEQTPEPDTVETVEESKETAKENLEEFSQLSMQSYPKSNNI